MRAVRILFAICFAVAGQVANAGCANYEDGSLQTPPQTVEICYNGVCDITNLQWECANVHSYSASYDIGWSMGCTMDIEDPAERCAIYWQGRPIDRAKYQNLTCRPVSKDAVCILP